MYVDKADHDYVNIPKACVISYDGDRHSLRNVVY
jgi:hypothetical protein